MITSRKFLMAQNIFAILVTLVLLMSSLGGGGVQNVRAAGVPVITEGDAISVMMSKNGTPVAFSLTLHATDEDPTDTLTWTITTPPANGTASVADLATGASAAIGYTPSPDYTGTDTFVVQVSNGSVADTIQVNVSIAPKVGLLVDTGGIGDNGLNALAYQGLLQAQANLGVTTTLYSPTDQSQYSAKLQQCADDGNDLCIAIGFTYAVSLAAAARANQDTKWGILDYSYPDCWPGAVEGVDCGSFTDIPNVRGITFNAKQAGYLAGTLAGKMTTSNVVGAVGGMEISSVTAFMDGYRNGAQCANPNVNVLNNFTGTFSDPSVGATAAQNLIAQGADVIYGVAGQTGNGAITYSAQHAQWAIGVDSDQYLSVFNGGTVAGSDKLLTSTMKRLDNALFQTINDFLTGNFTSGPVQYGLASDGVGLAPFHETDSSIPQAAKDYLDSVKQGILNGSVNIDDSCAIEIWYSYQPGSVEETAFNQVIANARTANPGLRIITRYHSYNTIFQDYQTAVQAGSGPDMYIVPNDNLGNQARAGVLLNLDTYLAGQLTNVSQTAVNGMKVNGVLYGVPESAKAVALYYNKSKIPAPPTTTAELLSLLQSGKTLAAPGQGGGSYYFYGLWSAFGGQLMDTNGVCTADQGSGFADAMQYLLDSQSAGADLQTDAGTAQGKFVNGNRDMFVNGPWVLKDIEQGMGANLGVVPLPDGPSGTAMAMNGIDGFFVNPHTPDPVQVVDLALFLTNQASSQIFTDTGGHIPVRSDVTSSDPLIAAFAQASAQGEPRPQNKQLANYWGPFNSMVDDVLAGRISPQAGVVRACQLMNELNGFTPVITEGDTIAVTMSKNGTPLPFDLTLHATAPNPGDTLTWSISSDASHGSASASGTSESESISYAPDQDYTGTDSFVVQVSNGSMVDTIQVNVYVELGSIAGTVRHTDDTPITGDKISVSAADSSSTVLATTCTDPNTGQYTLLGLPLDTAITVYANTGDTSACPNSTYGWEYWEHATSNPPTPPNPITLTSISSVVGGIDFSLGMATPMVEYLIFNLNTSALQDLAVRQAIAYGTDRQRMLDQAWGSEGTTGTVQNSYVPDGQWAVAPDSALSLYPYNPDTAKAILTAAGWIDTHHDGIREKNGQKLILTFKTTTRWARQLTGTIFIWNMEQIGIQVNPLYYDPNFFFGSTGPIATKEFDIAEFATGACGSQADTTCVPYSMFLAGDPGNAMSYNNPLADAEYTAAQVASTPEEKLPHAIQHQVIISQDLPLLPLFTRIEGGNPISFPNFDVRANNDQVEAYGWPLGEQLTLQIDDPATVQNPDYTTTQTVGTASWDPNQTYASFNLRGNFNIQPGDGVSVSNGTTIKSLVVTNLAFTGFDVDQDLVHGSAAPLSHVDVWACDNNSNCQNRHVDADSAGTWTADFAHPGVQQDEQNTFDLVPGTWVDSSQGAGDTTNYGMNIPNPHMEVDPPGYWVNAREWPNGTPIHMTVTRSGNTVYTSDATMGQAPWDTSDPNDIVANFNLSNNNPPFDLHPGDVITMTGGGISRTHTITSLQVSQVDAMADTVSGTADPGVEIHVWVNSSNNVNRWVIANSSGDWTADFSTVGPRNDEKQIYDLQPGDNGGAQQYDANGSYTQSDWRVFRPWIQASPTGRWVQAFEWPMNANLTMTINGNGDYTATVGHTSWDPINMFDTLAHFDLPNGVNLHAGDVIQVTGGGATKTYTLTSLQVTGYDVANDIISGVATPGAQVQVCVNVPGNCISQWVTADGTTGDWTANYSGLFDIQPATNGWASEQNNVGDQTWFDWRVPRPWIQGSVTGNWVNAREWPNGTELTLTVDDPTIPGPVNYTSTASIGPSSWDPNDYVADFNMGTFHLKAGDALTVTDGTTAVSYTLTSLQVTGYDVVNDTVSGVATPGAWVQVCVNVPGNCITRWVQADGTTGNWTADYSGSVDIQPATNGWASEQNNAGDQTWYDWRVPRPWIEGSPNSNWVHAREWPNGTELTLTVDDPTIPGPVNYTSTASIGPSSWDPNDYVADFNMGAFHLQAGDLLTVTDGTTAVSYTLQPLNVTAENAITDTISGTGVPGHQLQVCTIISGNCVPRYVTVDPSGTWLANYHIVGSQSDEQQTVDLVPGSYGWVTDQNENGNQTWFDWWMPSNCYSLTANTSMGGSVDILTAPNCTTNTYFEDTEVQVQASPDLGYEFTNWSGDASGSNNPVTITMNADKTVSANFNPLPAYTISGNAGVAGAILSYTDGTPKIATADGSGNYSFTVSYNWSGTVTPALAGYTFLPTYLSYSNVLANQTGQNYTATATPSFTDVPTTYWAWNWIERLYSAGITGGCGGGNYCPNNSVTRAQMAIFLERGIHGSTYTPPAATGTVFGDVPLTYWAAAWIEKLFADGITGGCGGGNYCPGNPVTRAQMAIFLLRAEHGSSYTPPAATGTVFGDVPISYWDAAWIERLSAEGITGGCGGGNYCPNTPVTRAQMAIFLVRTFHLP